MESNHLKYETEKSVITNGTCVLVPAGAIFDLTGSGSRPATDVSVRDVEHL
jgi:mannose-6-phosphate isomerase-like protein (cupin superfamily)